MIIWLTGISGSGKTTVAEKIVNKYKVFLPNLINIDGDIIRDFFDKSLGYDVNARVSQIKRIQKICKFLEKQKLIIVVSALYSNEELMKWNRVNFSNYYEIYLEASLNLVKNRDPKGLYKKFSEGKEKNVVGFDIPWYAPTNYDLKISMSKNSKLDDVIAKISMNIKIFRDLESSNEN